VLEIVNEAKRAVGAELDSVIGFADEDITRNNKYERESQLGNLISDIIREWAKTDLAFQNSGGIRADIKKGNITKRTVYNVQPFDNTVVVIELTGKDIEDVLAMSLSNKYGGLQVSGAKIYYKTDHHGFKIKEIYIRDNLLKREAKYTVATNSYLAYGGEGYDLNRKGRIINDTGVNLRDVIINYIKDRKTIRGVKEKRYFEVY
ncbi:MAG: 5'-nucleotidase C-terminal domain-containing protein, partial [Candidatus Omnitrophica bacterium]|nr:5'-nucleotidase C-terminal domain-containing protein [Candidatus Omnitrophota bacterium]